MKSKKKGLGRATPIGNVVAKTRYPNLKSARDRLPSMQRSTAIDWLATAGVTNVALKAHAVGRVVGE